MNVLPNEVLQMIVNNLDQISLIHFSRADSRTHHISQEILQEKFKPQVPIVSYHLKSSQRIDLRKISRNELLEVIKKVDCFEQELILQDLLHPNLIINSQEEQIWVHLAAELFVKSSAETQKDFLMHLFLHRATFIKFSKAMIANFIFHSVMEELQKEVLDGQLKNLNMKKVMRIPLLNSPKWHNF